MPMYRIIDGAFFEGNPSPDKRRVTVHDLGHGHREVVVQSVVEWVEKEPVSPDWVAPELSARELAAEAEDRERGNRLRAARRAKTRCRRLVKVGGLDTMLTLTYQALEGDLGACKRHFDLFIKRMRRAIPGFAYVAAFERQQRGAWHVHIATHRIPPTLQRAGVKVKSWNVIRAAWREVIGGAGNIDVSRRSRFARKSPAKLASYLSKYMLKSWEEFEGGQRRYQASNADVPAPTSVEVVAANMADLIEMAYAFGADGDCEVCTAWLSRFGDTFYLCTERVSQFADC